jgi:hypothetical protein
MAEQREQLVYEIKIRGELDPAWAEWFEGLALAHDCDGNTVLTGPIVDHTALHSMLLKIRDLNLKLISVNEIVNGNGIVSDSEEISHETP